MYFFTNPNESMRYLLLIDNREVEFPDEASVEQGFWRGEITPETWIKIAEAESDWETVGEKFPYLANE